ncbi:PP2C family protein-serine/threonine phosphatase [Oceanobacillus bengalensis]|uniref:Phosphoserine phosphatase n=1 Tax=Oceanobacillus bengalensis TaxID=1435466 RepID=A0A494YRX4_9BACI|nr:PP2C family protein-serine/threonine phosphatase [Oceanobacillus bengalensis]RKQ12360.1 phosphoserine phosphatase [Oceanobacillus bengalensis]
MDKVLNKNLEEYKELLKNFINTQDERSLYKVERMSKSFIRNSVLPEEIVNLHIQAMDELYPDIANSFHHSMNFLLEAMISYGLAHQEFQLLREQQIALKSEISIAARMQETLLGTEKPNIDGLDIGVVSVPAHQMNGDYYHFLKGNDGMLGLAIADVIGKGIPAALCMSMIKYSIDSYPEESMRTNVILESLNRVVERNVESNMFITMIYAQYFPDESILRYSFAGHEPAYYFNAMKNTFEEVNTKGLVLGVLPNATYSQKELELEKDDMVIFLTDGVTECRDDGRFIKIQEVLNLIEQYKHLPAQDIVDRVFKYFEKLQDFTLRDDFTMIILKKEV